MDHIQTQETTSFPLYPFHPTQTFQQVLKPSTHHHHPDSHPQTLKPTVYEPTLPGSSFFTSLHSPLTLH